MKESQTNTGPRVTKPYHRYTFPYWMLIYFIIELLVFFRLCILPSLIAIFRKEENWYILFILTSL